MKTTIAVLAAVLVGIGATLARADDDRHFQSNASFTTRAITPFAIEGLTGDAHGRLYTTGRQPDTNRNCPIWRIGADGSRLTVAFIPNPAGCNPSGITFDAGGNLYVADSASGGKVWKVSPDAAGCASDDSSSPLCAAVPLAMAFATGVPGTNGLAFDRNGDLWTGDGTTGQGRVWKISPGGGICEPSFSGCVEAFRIQPMQNAAVVGRSNATVQPDSAPNPQPLVANGFAFTPEGDLYVADTARGAIWRVEFDRHGNVRSPMGCDATLSANALCLDAVLVAHPALEGVDGIALDRAGNIWSAANERNAIVVVGEHERVVEVFRNPVNAAGLRNAADSPQENSHILEFPTSPFLLGRTMCVAQSDGGRRDNAPRAAGEINAGGPVGARGKISCMDQALQVPGQPLPVR